MRNVLICRNLINHLEKRWKRDVNMYKKQFIIFKFTSNVQFDGSSFKILLPTSACFKWMHIFSIIMRKLAIRGKNGGTTKTNYASNNNTKLQGVFYRLCFFFFLFHCFFICKVSYRKSSFEAAKSKSRTFLRLSQLLFSINFYSAATQQRSSEFRWKSSNL